MATDAIGTSLYIDYSDFAKGIAEANRLIRQNEQEFKTAAAGMDDWSSTSEGLNKRLKTVTKTIELQRGKVSALEKEYARVKEEKGANSKSAQTLALRLEKERTALAKAEKESRDLAKALDDLGKETVEAGDNAEKTGGAFQSLLGANLAASAITGLASAAAGMVSSFMNAAEATRDYRMNIAKVAETSKAMGESMTNAKENMLEMAAVTGDIDAAGEAINNLMAAGIKGENLDKINAQLQGASIKWKDTLKMEGLADGLQETLATGNAIGPFAELLERGGKNLDSFNARLAACKTEAEKQNLVMQELSSMGLEQISAGYKEANKSMYDAELATLKYNDTMAAVGSAMEPINTLITTLKTNILNSFLPAIKNITAGLAGLATGAQGAGRQLAAGFGSAFSTIATSIVNAGRNIIAAAVNIVPEMITKLGEVLPHVIALVADYAKLAVMTITNGLGAVTQFMPGFFDNLIAMFKNGFTQILEEAPEFITSMYAMMGNWYETITTYASEVYIAIGEALAFGIQALRDKLPDIVNAITQGLQEYLPKVVEGATRLFNGFLTAIKKVLPVLSANLPQIIDTVLDAIKTWLPIIAENAFNLFKNIVKGIASAIPVIVKELPKIIYAIGEGLLKLAGTLATTGKEIFLKIKDGVLDSLDEMKDVGLNLVKGLWEGINDAKDWILAKVRGFGDTILKGFKDFFGIHSPSRETEEIGDYLGQGLAVGIEGSVPGAKNSAKRFSDAVIAEIEHDIARHKAAIARVLGVNMQEAAAGSTEGAYNAGLIVGNAVASGIEDASAPETIGGKIAESAAMGMENGKDNLYNAATNMINNLSSLDFSSGAANVGWQIGDMLVGGITSALTAAMGPLGTLIGTAVSGLFSIIKNGLQKSTKEVASSATAAASSAAASVQSVRASYNDSAYTSIAGGINSVAGAKSSDIAQRGNQYIILNQTNNSPEALSAAEVYRQSNKAVNLLAMAVR